MSGAKHWEQDKEATVYVGNLDERVTDSLVWELMLQAGRIVNVHLPKDRVTQVHQGYGFVEFISEEDAEYAARIMNQVRVYGKPIRVNKASADKQRNSEIGAELFVGNLDSMVTEQILLDTFSRFGGLTVPPKVARDENGLSKGYGFVSFSSFESSDRAIASLHGQYLMNKEVSVQYAYKKDGKGERHGDQAERMLAAQAREHNFQPLSTFIISSQTGDYISQAASGPEQESRSLKSQIGTSYQQVRPNTTTSMYAIPNGQTKTSNTAHYLPPPPSGLPARPPPSQVGYGGPPPNLLSSGFPVPTTGPSVISYAQNDSNNPGFHSSVTMNNYRPLR